MKEFGKRLSLAMAHANLTQAELAKASNIKQPSVNHAINKGNSSTHTATFAKVCGVSSDWLATGEGQMVLGDDLALDSLKIRENEVKIPIYGQEFGLGGHVLDINQDVMITQFSTSRQWIRDNLKHATKSENVSIVTGQGGSMGETIKDGSAVFIDLGITSFCGDNIYALKTNDESLMIKRVAKLSSGGYLLISDADHYPNEECEQIKIIGRVLGAMNFDQL